MENNEEKKGQLTYILLAIVGILLIFLFIQIKQISSKRPSRKVISGQKSVEIQEFSKSFLKYPIYQVKQKFLRDPFQFGSVKNRVPLIISETTKEEKQVQVSKELTEKKVSVPVTKAEVENEPTGLENLILQGFFEHRGKLAAVINDKLLKTGDTILGWRVVEIKMGQVMLEKNGTKKVLISLH